MPWAIGIDLGACKSVVAALRDGEPEVLPYREGRASTPVPPQLDSDVVMSAGPGHVRAPGAARGLPAPVERAALRLVHLREDAEAALGEPVRRAVLAVPVSSGQAERSALSAAARLAGLFVLRFTPSTTAAALAYSAAHPQAEPQTLLVFDLGGGCLDVAVLRLFRGAVTTLGLAGENWLGGNDLTGMIVASLLRRLQGERALLLDETRRAREELRRRLHGPAERAKVALSTVERVAIPLTVETAGLRVAVEEALSRQELEEMIRPRLEETLAAADRALAAAGMSREGVDAILPVGGSTQVPLVEALLSERFRRARLLRDFNPLLGVAMGAAVLTGMLAEVICPACGRANPVEEQRCGHCRTPLTGEERVCCPHCSLPNDSRRRVCWKCGAPLPAVGRRAWARRKRGRTCARCGAPHAPGRMVCAACCAPWPAASPGGLRCSGCGGVLAGGVPSCPACGELVVPFVGDVLDHSLGIEGEGGRLDVLFPRGCSLPTAQPAYREFPIAVGAGPQLVVEIYEGERPMARENRSCARLQVGLAGGLPAGSVLRVGFSLDLSGVLSASADPDDEASVWLE